MGELRLHVAAAAVRVMMLLASVTVTASLIAEESCSRFAPTVSATWAHCAASKAAAEATALSFSDFCLLASVSSAAMAARAAATPATEMAACTSALCKRFSSLRFCFISFSHFLIEIPFQDAIFLNCKEVFFYHCCVVIPDIEFVLHVENCTSGIHSSSVFIFFENYTFDWTFL